MKKLSILLASSDNSISSGAFNSLVFVAKGLLENGHNVLVVLPSNGDGEQLLDTYNIPYEVVPSDDWIVFDCMSQNEIIEKKKMLLRNSKMAIAKIHKIILERDVDIVHINTLYHFVAALAAIGTKAKVIWHFREFLEEAQAAYMINQRASLSLIECSSAIICVSESLKAKYAKALNNKKLCVIYNGIDKDKYQKASHQVFNNKTIRLLCVGGIVPSKGQLDVCRAIGYCRKELPDNVKLELDLVGFCSEEAKTDIENICREFKINNVNICGRQKNVVDYYKRADILCMSSTSEAFGRVTVEAMMAGCLVIGKNSAGTAEIIQHKSTGLLYNNIRSLADAILWSVNNVDQAKKIAKNGKKYAETNYSADLNCKNIEQLYRQALGKPEDNTDRRGNADEWLCRLFRDDSQSVAAVVVTHNRKQLLVECISAILKQSHRVNMVYIIDNASTDGCKNELEKHGWTKDERIKYVKLKKNIGGSGGFYEGIKLANQQKFDWIWVMDDDTIPKPECLECLLIAQAQIPGELSFLASVIRGSNGAVMNTPGLHLLPSENGYLDIHEYLGLNIIQIDTATFVSVLLNNRAVDTMGYPCRDYFIWGDDTEYTMRLTTSYAPAYLVGTSEAIHKRKESRTLSIIDENESDRLAMYFYLYRNTLINQRTYFGKRAAIRRLRDDYKDMRRIIMTKKCQHRKMKLSIIHRAHMAYLRRNYDLTAFLGRYNKDTRWKSEEDT